MANPFAFLKDPVNGKSPQAKAHALPRNSVKKQKRIMKKTGVNTKYVRKP
jgi:hypothetical protein